jgi:MFS family permease
MIVAAVMAAGAGVFALAIDLLPDDWNYSYIFAVAFLLIGFSQAGIRMGRKTYLVDYAPKDKRPLYAALGNTIVGAVALAGSALGLVVQFLGLGAVIALLIVLALVGALICRSLPELSDS